ncbi:unnamed protein product [Paramecium pentaurelia]|uniref:Uncharacterized protein n=1 Tax=Paramecium pentaurelia TaxID=43138 RepID=A0A8S1TFQ8_9CILI|nr:unnamed protein product [Paramecium pentaurelia]
MSDQSYKLVPDQNIALVFDQALNANDDYIRLQKISEGIKYITQNLPQAKTFANPKLMFQLMCLYPFQKSNIESLISAFFEYFQDFRFISSFFESASNISMLQETSTQTLKQRITMLSRFNINNIFQSKTKDNNDGQQFSQAVNQEIVTIKLFTVNYLKKFFELANKLQLDFQLYCLMFKNYIQNSTNQKLFENVMDCYQDLRFTIFAKCDWINQFSEEIIIFFNNTPKLFPSYTKYQTIVIEEDSDSEIVSQTQIIIPQQQNRRRSYISTEQDPSLYLQNLCCKQDPNQPLQHHSALEEVENLDILIQFVLDPVQISIASLWVENYPKLPEIIDNDKNIYKQKSKYILNQYQVLRSFKTLQILTNIENFKNLLGQHSQIFAKIFSFININLYDETKNINLHHLAILIKFLINFQPKFCIKQLIEQKIFPKLLEMSYNPSINQLLIDIINFNEDIIQLGIQYLEQLWSYLHQFYFLQLLSNYSFDGQISSDIHPPDQAAYNEIFQVIKAQSIFDPQRLQQQLLKQETQNIQELTTIQSKNDYDNLEVFQNEKQEHLKRARDDLLRRQSSILISQNSSKVNQNQKGRQCNIDLSKIQSNTSLQDVDGKLIQYSQNIDNQLNSGNTKTSPLIRLRNKTSQHGSKSRIKSEQDIDLHSNDGFSSSKLIQIYPTTKSVIFLSDFEKEKLSFNKNIISENHLRTLILLFNQLIDFAEKQQDIQQKLTQTQIFNIDQFTKSIMTEKNIYSLFKVFLYSILEIPHNPTSLSVECGILLNNLYIKIKIIQIFENYKELLKNQFQLIIDYLVKCIVQLNSIRSKLDSTSFAFKQYILVSIMTNGLLLYDRQNYMVKIDKNQKSVFRNLTDTMLHIIIIWFSDSQQNTIYQQVFTKFITIFFAGAPIPYLSNIIFKLGLVSTLYNAYTKFYQNEMRDTSYVEGIFFYILLINYIIRNAIKVRNLSELQSALIILDSWQQLEQAQPFENTMAMRYADQLINLEYGKQVDKVFVKKNEEKNNKQIKTKSQINQKVNPLISQQKKISESNTNSIVQMSRAEQSQKKLI